MIRHEEYRKVLQRDVEVPEKVWLQFEETLENIESLTSERREERCMEMKKNRKGRTWIKAAVVAGVVTVGGSIFCYNNPVIASKIPVIGNIFEQVEDDVTFSGDYAKKEVLEDTESTTEKVLGEQDGVYTVKNNGITFTASEIYCDGYSLYLTAKVESEKGGFQNIPEHYTRCFGGKTSKSISTDGTWEINDLGEEAFPSSIELEGKAVDDHTFIGMIKLDLKQYSEEDGTLKLKVSDLWYDDKTVTNTDSIEPTNRIAGEWKLTVPYSVDKEQCKEVLVNTKNKDGYGIQKVFVSPYQVIVFSEAPYTTISPDTYTKEYFEEVWGEKNKELIAQGEEPVTYEELLKEKHYEYVEAAAYNQDGEALEEQYGVQYDDGVKTVFAIQGKTLSKLHIYLGDESHEMELIKAENEQEAKEKSILDAEVDLK